MRNLQCVTAVVLLLAATSCAARTLQQTPHEECVFPFMHEGEERNECVVVDGELMCKDNLEHFIDCESGDHRHDHEEDDHSHDSCEFPFLHEGRNFTECLLLDRQPVCKDDLGHWLNCGTGHHLDEDEEDDHAHDEDEEDDHDDHDEDEDEDEDHDHDEDEDHDHDEDEDHDHDEDEDEDHDEDEDEDHNDGINVRICTVGDQEQEFCEAMGPVMSAALAGSGFSFSCMEYNSADDCLTAIASGDVDIRSVDSSDIFHAWSAHGLRAIAHEVYEEGPSGGEFYSVALVRSEFCDDSGFVGLHSLAGTRSCHVGYRNMAGWRLPLGDLMAQDHVAVVSDQSNVENDAETMASYFSSICAPRTSGNGPVNTEDGSGALWDPLCSGCTSPDIENEADRCTVHDPYYSYTGAFRCLAEGAGDVAFVKHSTVLDYAADGRTPAAWATDGMDAFRLLCPSGGCAPVDGYRGCNLAKVPAHAVIASPLRSFVEDGSLAGALDQLGSDADFSSMVFNASANPRDFVFKGTAISLDPVTGDTGSYLGTTALALEFLGTVESN